MSTKTYVRSSDFDDSLDARAARLVQLRTRWNHHEDNKNRKQPELTHDEAKSIVIALDPSVVQTPNQ